MTEKVISFDEWFKSEPNLETREKQAAKIAWNACNEMHEYQYNEEIDSLKDQLKEKDEKFEQLSNFTGVYLSDSGFNDCAKYDETIKQKDAEIEKKDEQINLMKNCFNCNYLKIGVCKASRTCKLDEYNNVIEYDKWEIR